MKVKVSSTRLIDCYRITPLEFKDNRGAFIKTFHADTFESHNLISDFKEQYYSISEQGVLRGLHFQVPPTEHTKLVYCISGRIQDVVVDLRVGSPTYGQYELFELSDTNRDMIYVPPGMAHGFYTMSKRAVVICNLSTVYSPEHDGGIRWDSVDIPWPTQEPILSEKDKNLTKMSDFLSPFRYQK